MTSTLLAQEQETYPTGRPLLDNLMFVMVDRGYDPVGKDGEDHEDWERGHRVTNEELLPHLTRGESIWPFLWDDEVGDWYLANTLANYQLLCILIEGWAAIEHEFVCLGDPTPAPTEKDDSSNAGPAVTPDPTPLPPITGNYCIWINADAHGFPEGVCNRNVADSSHSDDWSNITSITVEVRVPYGLTNNPSNCSFSVSNPANWSQSISHGGGEWFWHLSQTGPNINAPGDVLTVECFGVSKSITIN